MDEPQSILIAAGICIVFLAVISGIVVTVSRVQLGILKRLAEEEENRKAQKLLKMLKENKRQLLVGLWGLRSLLTVIISAMVTFWAIKTNPGSYAFLFQSIGITILTIIILTDILPRSLISSNPERVAFLIFPVIKSVEALVVPFIKVVEWLFSPVLMLVRPKDSEARQLSEDEIKRIVEESGEMGVLDEEETEMIQSIFGLGDTIAREVMIPRVDMICADRNSCVRDVIKIMTDSGFSRIPVYEGSIDQILGVILARDLLCYIGKEKNDVTAYDIARKPPYFIPETKKVDELLREMRKESISMAIVVDEYGGTDGLITIEDILEEIVGEITDEHDKETPDIEEIGEDEFMVDAGTIIENVNDELGINVPTEEQETIAGFVYGILGHIPKEGEVVTEQDLGIEITVKEVQGQRITKLKIKKIKGNGNEE